MWAVFNLGTHELMVGDTKEDITKRAISKNRKNSDAMILWRIDEVNRRTYYMGYLFREFGHDFDPKDCWRK